MTPGAASVAVVGGGLAGLAVAEGLARAGGDVHLFEARDRVGGRILSRAAASGWFDLGPAWIWPHNARMLGLAARLGVSLYPQHAAGNLVFEDGAGQIRRDLSLSTMGGALRVAGGIGRLAEALAARIPPDRLHLGHRVDRVERRGAGLSLGGTGPDGAFALRAGHVVLALPPRLAAGLSFAPAPGAPVKAAMEAVPTWMAGHAKVVAVYAAPFWRAAGLSGDAISHRGPLMEIHDATDEAAGVPALFGFANPARTGGGDAALAEAAVAHLARLFGPAAASPARVLVKNWREDPATATARDAEPLAQHPAYGVPRAVAEWAGDGVLFAGTEAAPREGGFLEGALEAAETALARLSVAA